MALKQTELKKDLHRTHRPKAYFLPCSAYPVVQKTCGGQDPVFDTTVMRLAAFLTAVVTAGAYVCTPDMCVGVEQANLTCPGSVIKGGGFCGCTDTCAKV